MLGVGCSGSQGDRGHCCTRWRPGLILDLALIDVRDDAENAMADIADPNQPFLDHLVALLAVYEHGTSATPIPRYDGPSNWQTASILRSIESLGRRAPAADAATGSISSSAASSSSTSDSAIPHDVAGAAGAHALSDSDELQLLRTQAAAVAQVCDSVYEGDFSRRVAVPVQGPLMVHLSDSVNNMVRRTVSSTASVIMKR